MANKEGSVMDKYLPYNIKHPKNCYRIFKKADFYIPLPNIELLKDKTKTDKNLQKRCSRNFVSLCKKFQFLDNIIVC